MTMVWEVWDITWIAQVLKENAPFWLAEVNHLSILCELCKLFRLPSPKCPIVLHSVSRSLTLCTHTILFGTNSWKPLRRFLEPPFILLPHGSFLSRILLSNFPLHWDLTSVSSKEWALNACLDPVPHTVVWDVPLGRK